MKYMIQMNFTCFFCFINVAIRIMLPLDSAELKDQLYALRRPLQGVG